jgi:signal transduction histidine kinase
VLGQDATILATNQTWERSAGEPGASPLAAARVGQSYLELCRRAADIADSAEREAREAREAADGIRAVLDGALPLFMMSYRVGSSDVPRWFLMQVIPLPLYAGGAIVQHIRLSLGAQAEAVRAEAEWADSRAREEAARLNAERMEFFMAMTGHEIRTPLAIIKSYQQMAEQWLGPRLPAGSLPRPLAQALAAARQALAEAQHAAGTLTGLLDDLLLASRAKAGALVMYPRCFELAPIVRGIVREQREVHPGRSVRVRLERQHRAWVEADAARIGQVLTNYLNNACKYSPLDQPIEVRLRIVGRAVRVAVRDYGPGLAAGEQARIWERFYQAAGVEPQGGATGGLGLGLYISRHIIERHQGHVGVESAPGKGATFWFTLPLVEAGD